MKKIEEGIFFTDYDPFESPPFKDWFLKGLKNSNKSVLEPFAGSNNLIKMLIEHKYKFNYESFDINPASKDVIKRDTIKNFPKGFNLVVTNPPYLSKVSAKRKGLKFEYKNFNDLYKVCLGVTLENVDYLAAIIPASFIRANVFRNRLESYVLLNKKMFNTTETPVCLALFSPQKDIQGTSFFKLNVKLPNVEEIEQRIEKRYSNLRHNEEIKFNDPEGNVGLRCVDSPKGKTISFVMPSELKDVKIKNSSRHLTLIKINCELNLEIINSLNEELEWYRENTFDLFLNPFMGLRKDGDYRRRLDYKTARKIILKVINKL